MSLASLRIAITASRRASELAHLISSFGGIPRIAPTVGIDASNAKSKEAENFIKRIVEGRMDYVIFMTGPAVYSFMSVAKSLGLEKRLVEALQQAVIIARSFKPKDALARYGIKTDIIPEENTSMGIIKLLKNYHTSNKRVGVLWHGSYSPVLRDELKAVGAEVLECSIYTYSLELKEAGANILKEMGFDYKTPMEARVVELIVEINKGLIDAITFTSPPAALDFFKIAESHHLKESLQLSLNQHVIVVAVGPSTEKALEESGVKVDVMPKTYKMGAMVKALNDYIKQSEAFERRKTLN
jgi:uroporphyrinogen-III synthase